MSGLTTQPARASREFAIGGDLPVVRLGYGAMQLPGPGVWGEPRDHDEVIRVLRRAVELGVTFIDTADSYGPEVSERLIHEALHPYPDDLVIATKAGLTRPPSLPMSRETVMTTELLSLGGEIGARDVVDGVERCRRPWSGASRRRAQRSGRRARRADGGA